MADPADIANDYIIDELNRALKGRQDQPVKMGPKLCKECEEEIPDARRKLGFQFCKECAEENERRKSLFAEF